MTLKASVAVRRMHWHRFIRKLHVWIGAWGAIAAVLFGVSGFVQNHRGMLRIPQGNSAEVSRVEIAVPESARVSPEALKAWFAESQHLPLEQQRGGPGAQGDRDRRAGNSNRWTFTGGNARTTVQAEYVPGSETATLRTNVQSTLAVLERLHKGVGGGIAWILLSDSFAIGMVALGLSGLIMWARGRTARQMVFSIVGAAAVVVALIAGSAVL
jgi:hypothetical protein